MHIQFSEYIFKRKIQNKKHPIGYEVIFSEDPETTGYDFFWIHLKGVNAGSYRISLVDSILTSERGAWQAGKAVS